MRAVDVYTAAKITFSHYGVETYAISKANNFLRRCGAKKELGPDQDIPKSIIDQVVYSMLDADSEQVFWANLNCDKGKQTLGGRCEN